MTPASVVSLNGRRARLVLLIALSIVTLGAFIIGIQPAQADPGLGHSFSINDVAQTEGTNSAQGAATNFVFTVSLVNEPGGSGQVKTDYVTRAGTATEGATCGGNVDYIRAAGTLTFQAEVLNASQQIIVKVCPDAIFEPDETFFVDLRNPTHQALYAKPTGLGTILNDDAQPLRKTSTSASCTPNTVPIQGPASCTVTVVDTDGGQKVAPAGTVNFTVNPTTATVAPNPCTLAPVPGSAGTSACQVTFTPSENRTYTVTAQYSGSQAHAASQGQTNVTVNKRTTTTTVACTPDTIEIGLSTVCTAIVTDNDSPAKSPPTGTVTFSRDKAGTFAPPSCALTPSNTEDTSTCSVTYTPEEHGTHQITATYSGDAVHSTSSGQTRVTVNKRPTTTKVTCEPNRIEVETSTICTVVVIDTAGGALGGPPVGIVNFSSDKPGTFVPEDCELAPSGTDRSTCQTTYTPTTMSPPTAFAEGAHQITAEYEGDVLHNPSRGSTSVTVTRRNTRTEVVCEPDTVAIAVPATCTAVVIDTSGGLKTPPEGTVTFQTTKSGVFAPNPCALAPTGADRSSCTVTYTPNDDGPHAITGAYSGGPLHSPSEGKDSLTVTRRQTRTDVVCEPDTVAIAVPVSCTAVVIDTEQGGAGTPPQGTVSFTSTKLGVFAPNPCVLAAAGTNQSSCSITYTPNEEGSHEVTGAYSGSPIHSVSQGNNSVMVTRRQTTTIVDCTPNTVEAGMPSQCVVIVEDADAGTQSPPEGTVSFVVISPAPAPATAVFTPNTCTLVPVATDPDRDSSSCRVSFSSTKAEQYTIEGSYSGSPLHKPSKGQDHVTVEPGPPAKLVLTPIVAENPVNTQHCVTARVTDVFENPVQGVVVRFVVTGSNFETGNSATDQDGEAEFCYVGQLFGVDLIHAYADNDGDGYRDANETAQDTATNTWVLPPSTPGCEITIHTGGWIKTLTGDKGTFGGNARIEADGTITRGQLEYTDHNPLLPIKFHSIDVLVIVCRAIDANGDGVDDGQGADIYGTGEVDGIGLVNFRVRVSDRGEPGSAPGPDTYQIITAAYASGPEDNPLQGGNIQIRRFQ